jgi:hypothetical protein
VGPAAKQSAEGKSDFAKKTEHLWSGAKEGDRCGAHLKKQIPPGVAPLDRLLLGNGVGHGQEMANPLGQSLLVDADPALGAEGEQRPEKGKKTGVPGGELRGIEGKAKGISQLGRNHHGRRQILIHAPAATARQLQQIIAHAARIELPLLYAGVVELDWGHIRTITNLRVKSTIENFAGQQSILPSSWRIASSLSTGKQADFRLAPWRRNPLPVAARARHTCRPALALK